MLGSFLLSATLRGGLFCQGFDQLDDDQYSVLQNDSSTTEDFTSVQTTTNDVTTDFTDLTTNSDETTGTTQISTTTHSHSFIEDHGV